jgi:hypothetical protein
VHENPNPKAHIELPWPSNNVPKKCLDTRPLIACMHSITIYKTDQEKELPNSKRHMYNSDQKQSFFSIKLDN